MKPKLDRFLTEKNDKSIVKNFRLKDKEALDYKVTISPTSEVKSWDIETIKLDKKSGKPFLDKRGKTRKNSFPAFFANMGSDEDDKKFTFCETLQIEFFSFHTDLIPLIEKYIAEFFATHNFGTRQSKGFGSFYLSENQDKAGVYKPISDFYRYQFYADVFSDEEYSKWFSLFETIDLFYRAMRSGINQKGRNDTTQFYFKSLAFLYAKSKGWQWEKKTIKENFFSHDLNRQTEKHYKSDILEYENDKKYLVRDLFGLSSDELWLSYRTSISKKHNEIDRFKSPIIFKPIFDEAKGKYITYFKATPIPHEYLNQSFQIKSKKGGFIKLSTPPEFEFDAYFNFIFDRNNFDIEDHVDEKFHEHDYFTILYNTFYDIYENL